MYFGTRLRELVSLNHSVISLLGAGLDALTKNIGWFTSLMKTKSWFCKRGITTKA